MKHAKRAGSVTPLKGNDIRIGHPIGHNTLR
jgi:hypothetical protein